jgi:hypothetical protein
MVDENGANDTFVKATGIGAVLCLTEDDLYGSEIRDAGIFTSGGNFITSRTGVSPVR